jgi:hypothetical protein
MIEEVLRKIARQLMALDDGCLTALLPKYKERMHNFNPTPEWEEAVLIYYFINGLRIKNSQFEDKILEYMNGQEITIDSRPKLRLIKFQKDEEKD